MTGVIAGLVTNYPRAYGQFDRWAADPDYGGRLDVGDLDLTGKRNHILRVALDALPAPDRQLLSLLALLSEATDYDTIKALNPHVPAEPASAPRRPEGGWDWKYLSARKRAARVMYAAEMKAYQGYLEAHRAWERSPERALVAQRLDRTVADLEKRGLLQVDRGTSRYDLHPVVRSVAAAWLPADDRDRLGQRVIDHFSSRPQNPYEEADTLDDLQNGLTVVRTLLHLGRLPDAYDAYKGDLSHALLYYLEAYNEILALLRPFFTHGWNTPSPDLAELAQSYLANDAGIVLSQLGEYDQALAAKSAGLNIDLDRQDWDNVRIALSNCTWDLYGQNRLAPARRLRVLALELAEHLGNWRLSDAWEDMYAVYVDSGRMGDAERMWAALNSRGLDGQWAVDIPGHAALLHARYLFEQGTLTDDDLSRVVQIATAKRHRQSVRELHRLRGWWLADHGQWAAAADSLSDAVRMAREADITDADADALLALARHHLGQLADPRAEAERLAALRQPAHLHLAHLWHALGDTDEATTHALAAYRHAWADGEPHVHRHDLNRATTLLRTLGAEIPDLPAYNPADDPPPDWETRAATAIHDLLRQDDNQG
ncbi:hypothetical protein [Frankia tisae]|uniref:hypothetical protein n=1 Tax=Frankia tisae TaxID=2950104 RepID=UPI0021C0D721|nr:hypothetical protein [Frankia tisae]